MASVAEAMAAFAAKVERMRTAPSRARDAVAARVLAKFRADATTRRGNVPEFAGPGRGFIDNPITTAVTGDGVVVKSAGWVMRKAEAKGQPDEWQAIAAEEIRREMGRP